MLDPHAGHFLPDARRHSLSYLTNQKFVLMFSPLICAITPVGTHGSCVRTIFKCIKPK